jgi:hypothetical protein
MVPQQRRSGTIREERVEYTIDADRFLSNAPLP